MHREQHSRAAGGPHLACPFCSGYEIGRMFVASADLDSCECFTCGARWDEDRKSGEYRGRSLRASFLIHHDE